MQAARDLYCLDLCTSDSTTRLLQILPIVDTIDVTCGWIFDIKRFSLELLPAQVVSHKLHCLRLVLVSSMRESDQIKLVTRGLRADLLCLEGNLIMILAGDKSIEAPEKLPLRIYM